MHQLLVMNFVAFFAGAFCLPDCDFVSPYMHWSTTVVCTPFMPSNLSTSGIFQDAAISGCS